MIKKQSLIIYFCLIGGLAILVGCAPSLIKRFEAMRSSAPQDSELQALVNKNEEGKPGFNLITQSLQTRLRELATRSDGEIIDTNNGGYILRYNGGPILAGATMPTPSLRPEIEQLADIARENKNLKITVQSYSSSTADNEDRLRAQLRAEAVVTWLLISKVPQEQLHTNQKTSAQIAGNVLDIFIAPERG